MSEERDADRERSEKEVEAHVVVLVLVAEKSHCSELFAEVLGRGEGVEEEVVVDG